MKRHIFKAMLLFLALAATLSVSACGGTNNKFEVEYIGTANIMSPNLYIAGSAGGEKMKLSLVEAFKDCRVTDIAFPDEMTMGGTEDGHVCYTGGVIVSLSDSGGNTFTVTVKEGGMFDTVNEDGTVYLLPQQ